MQTICPVLKCYREKNPHKLPRSCDHTKIAACVCIFSLLEVDCRHTRMSGCTWCCVLWFYLMPAQYMLVRSRPAFAYALVHSHGSENYNTSRSLWVVGNLCVCFLNIKEGEKQIFRNTRNNSSVKWPVVLPHLTTLKVKIKYWILMVAYIYLEICIFLYSCFWRVFFSFLFHLSTQILTTHLSQFMGYF